jgi:hypothetical protein
MHKWHGPACVRLETIEQRRLLSVTIQAALPATLLDDDGSRITIRLSGTGSATADTVSGRLTLDFAGTNESSSIAIDVAGGDGKATARSIESRRGTIGSIRAPAVELRGTLAAAWIDALDVRALIGADVQVSWLGSLSAKQISNSRISADRIGQISVSSNVAGSRILASPANDKKAAIETIVIKGDLDTSAIFAVGDIGSVTARAMYHSTVSAGVRISEFSTSTRLIQPLPAERSGDKLYDFIGTYRIGTLTVTGLTSRAIAFSDTIIGAHQIGQVTLHKVDGATRSSGAEFGVAAYSVGTVTRSFEKQYTALDVQAEPNTEFVVRQIVKPLNFNPGNGSYGGSGSYGGGGAISGGGTLNLGGSGTSVTIPVEGLRIAAITNSPANSLYLTHGGNYELRKNSGSVVFSAVTLGAVAAELFRQSRSSVKVEKLGSGTVTLRATSVGPAVQFFRAILGTSWYAYSNANGPFEPMSVSHLPTGTTRAQRDIPPLSQLDHELTAGGMTTRYFTESLMLVKDERYSIGALHSALGSHDVGVTQSLRYAVQDQSSPDAAKLIMTVTADRVGSRRLPARFVTTSDGIIVYGLPDGSTAQLRECGRTALNAVGELRKLAMVRQIRDALIQSGLDVGN